MVLKYLFSNIDKDLPLHFDFTHLKTQTDGFLTTGRKSQKQSEHKLVKMLMIKCVLHV